VRFGIPDVIGWVLTLVGLALVAIVVYLAMNRYVFEAMALSLPSVVVFRGGLGLIRMAMAGRIARDSIPPNANTNSGGRIL